VPTVFLPYPYHRDEHQRWNAAVLVEAGGAAVLKDEIEPERTMAAFDPVLGTLLGDRDAREAMRGRLRALGPADGAARVAALVVGN
jgi:UDP-N-acetylglucosamine--N-acetylmuramyl-(pentapeptide) pyrophosphoryl-undecaprenol N-acetylglucosamine transferase